VDKYKFFPVVFWYTVLMALGVVCQCAMSATTDTGVPIFPQAAPVAPVAIRACPDIGAVAELTATVVVAVFKPFATVATDAVPVSDAVIVPAEKSPLPSLLTIVDAVFAFVAALAASSAEWIFEAEEPSTDTTVVAFPTEVTSPVRFAFVVTVAEFPEHAAAVAAFPLQAAAVVAVVAFPEQAAAVVAVAEFPVQLPELPEQFPVTLPVTLPIRFPVKLLPVIP
jgi:hypothetical protein